MVDRQLIMIAGAVAAALGVSIALLSGLYGVFRDQLGVVGAIILAAVVLIIFALLVLAIDNRIKINELKRGDEE